jgi:Na+-transporting methylmalonyl-CoA/oxaloacetate decarboxylase gamma subunit
LDVQAGINVTIIGMGLVFLALAILMLAIMTLNRVFRPKGQTTAGAMPDTGRPEEAAIAAIALALSLALEEEAEIGAPEPVTVLSIHRAPGAWAAHSRLRSTE